MQLQKTNLTMTQHPFNSTIEQSQMAEAQIKIRDREMHDGIWSTNFIQCYCKNKDKIHKIKYVNDIIQDLERYGPAGLIHIAVLSSIIERPIKIWNANGSLNKIIGRRKTGQPVNIEYHATEGVGHWTLRGGKDSDNVVTDLNSCLFSVIGFQIGQDPLNLRKWTVLKLKNNFQNVTKWVDKIQLERNDKMILMIGGAKYEGTSAVDAKRILDNSEGARSCYTTWGEKWKVKPSGSYDKVHYQYIPKGHARKHSLKDNPPSPNDYDTTVEEFSRQVGQSIYKSGFLSRADQNHVTHLALKTDKAQDAMTLLNSGAQFKNLWIEAVELRIHCGQCTLPRVKTWRGGDAIAESEQVLTSVSLTLSHHESEFSNRNADVLIITCYPNVNHSYLRSKEEKGSQNMVIFSRIIMKKVTEFFKPQYGIYICDK